MDLKVGDTVFFGADASGCPVWDLYWRRPVAHSAFRSGVVVKVDSSGFIVSFIPADGVAQRWRCAGRRPVDAGDEWFCLAEEFIRRQHEAERKETAPGGYSPDDSHPQGWGASRPQA